MTARLFLLGLVVAAAVTLSVSHAPNSEIQDPKSFTESMLNHFQVLENARHPRNQSRDAWTNTRQYILGEFEKNGLQVELQCFNTSVTVEYEHEEEVTGCNVIGTSMGTSTKNLLVVGAHYDSSGIKTGHAPLRDNGVGVAVMLEVVSALEGSIRWKGFVRNYTTIFVAFDLNTGEQFPKSTGWSGARHFVNNYLVPKLQKERRSLNGSFILDSIATYNTEEQSQTLSADFKTVFPEAYERITNSSNKGDFLAAITLDSVQGSGELVQDFAGHYQMDRKSRPFRLQEMINTNDRWGTGDTLAMVNHQASFHFWTAKPALPSVLLTDTANKRMVPAGEDCVDGTETDCNYIFPNPDRMKFVYHTYRALSETILGRQTTYVGLASSGGASISAVLMLLLSAAVALLLAQR